MIEALTDRGAFNTHSRRAWAQNVEYWLAAPLRHVEDVGDYIVHRVDDLRAQSGKQCPVVVDMGCGSAWLLGALREAQIEIDYVGLDNNRTFIDCAKKKYESVQKAHFFTVDLIDIAAFTIEADIVVNAFNFFELPDLTTAMANASSWLNIHGTLLMSTIDKTYLILALSNSWKEFHENLVRYQELPGVKFGFQKIDLGIGVSDILEYPSILYSTEDYISAAQDYNMRLYRYKEDIFTAKTVPKIYCHFEFRKESESMLKESTSC